VNVLGLDLSITAAGLAADNETTETVGGPARDGDRRLITIRNRVRRWLRIRDYELAVIEGPGFASTRIFSVAMVHGVVRAELLVAEVPFVTVAPSTLHAFATGDGGASKAEMKQAAAAATGRAFHDDNQADAWWLRRMGTAALGDHDGLTDDQIERLGHVQGWPLRVDPYGPDLHVGQIAQCRHKIWSLRNGDHWMHPFTVSHCDNPPK
jgi:Holliday junction resolvasome RuvABC endonuclease subunit